MSDYSERAGLQVATGLVQLIEADLAPQLRMDAARFWKGFAAMLDELVPVNQALLARRDSLQRDIDEWHRARRGQPFDVAAHESHLRSAGYLVEEGRDFSIGTQNVDAEISRLAGPQLVVPLSNARYALNAANARWGSLYDALYGTDAVEDTGELARGKGYNPARGREVIARARALLDQAVPLASGSHRDAIACGADTSCRWRESTCEVEVGSLCRFLDSGDCMFNSVESCVWASACTGQHTYCFQIETSAACSANVGCTWIAE